MSSKLAYIGGYFDAEGHIHANESPYGGLLTHVRVESTDEAPLVFMQSEVGGSIVVGNRKTSTGKLVYRWILSGPAINNFLRAVYPWIVLKKPQAAIMFKLRKTIQQFHDTAPAVRLSRKRCIAKLNGLHNSKNGPRGRPPRKELLAYAAGVLDGDGHVRYTNKGRHSLTLDVCGKARTLPELFLTAFGGSIYSGRNYHWNLYGSKAEELFARLQPYCLLKKDTRSVETARATTEFSEDCSSEMEHSVEDTVQSTQ